MEKKPVPSTNFMGPATFGLLLIAVLFGGSLAWAHFAQISGAVIAQGAVGIQGKPKDIQHMDGGIVEAINVSAGDLVKKGDIVIELDDTNIAANVAIYRGRLRDALVKRNRLIAEMDDRADFAPPSETDVKQYQLEGIEAAIEQQKALLNVRRQAISGEIAQYDKKIAQLNDQIAGARAVRIEKQKEIAIYQQERSSVETLTEQALVAKNQLLTFDRAIIELNSQIAAQDSEMARLANSISEAEIARLQIRKQSRERDATELEETEVKIDEMKQQITATALQLQRTSIRAPVDGIIHELAVHTIGGVIQPAQVVMQIIPTKGNLDIEVNVDPRSVDEIQVGRSAIVRFPSFHQRTTPEIFGKVTQISPSSIVDEKTGAAFYRVRIAVSRDEMAKLGGKILVPGMPVEAVMPTEERTVLSYLLKPLADQFEHALREQ